MDISYNQLSTLPPEITKLKGWATLDLTGNPICEADKSVRNFYQDLLPNTVINWGDTPDDDDKSKRFEKEQSDEMKLKDAA